MTDLATIGDVTTFWRPLSAAETTQATALLPVASAIVRDRFSDIDTRIAKGKISAATVKLVVVGLIRRYMTSRDPDEAIESREGPFMARWAEAAGAEMALTDGDLALLAPPSNNRPRKIDMGLGITPP